MLICKQNARKALVVKDEPLILKSIETKLRREGFEVISCTNIESALKAINEEEIDVIITGLSFSINKESSFELIKNIKKIFPFKPIIAISKKEDSKMAIQKSIECGAVCCLRSPIKLNELVIQLNSFLSLI